MIRSGMLCFNLGLNFCPKSLPVYARETCNLNSFILFRCHNINSPVVRKFSTSFNSKSDLRVLFLGSDAFSISSLEAVLRVFPPTSLTVVVSNANNLVAKYAKRKDIQLCLWDTIKKATLNDGSSSNTQSKSILTKFHLGVVSSFGHLIPERVIRTCQMGILNVHGSLLPKWRGAAPVAHAIINGDATTGISIMKIAPYKFDIGPVLYQNSVPIHPHIRTPELTQLLASVGSNSLELILQNLDAYLDKALPQNEKESTLSPKICPEMSHVQWESQSVEMIYNLYRGLSGLFKLKTHYMGRIVDLDSIALFTPNEDESKCITKNPGEFVNRPVISKETDFNTYYDSPVMVHVKDLPNSAQLTPGYIHYSEGVLCVKCTSQDIEDPKKNWIFIRKVKIGTKWMSANDFRNGFLSKPMAASGFESKTIQPQSEQLDSDEAAG